MIFLLQNIRQKLFLHLSVKRHTVLVVALFYTDIQFLQDRSSKKSLNPQNPRLSC